MKEVQDRLRHSDIKTTMNIYTHVTEKERGNSNEVCPVYEPVTFVKNMNNVNRNVKDKKEKGWNLVTLEITWFQHF